LLNSIKFSFFLTSFFFILNTSFAQSYTEIKQSDAYYWGEGKGKTLEIADKNALKDLISQISVSVEFQFKSLASEENNNYKEYAQSVINTYSNATLTRTDRKVIETPEEITVLRYITKLSMDSIFIERKNKIFEYIKSAKIAENENRIGDALKYYYWSLALLRSHPDCNKIKYNITGDEQQLLMSAIPDKINSIFSPLNISISDITNKGDDKSIILAATYKNVPVQNLDFTYWTGDTWSNLNSAKNGMGVVDYLGKTSGSFSDIRLHVEYMYVNNSKIDEEVNSVIENTNIPYFKQAEIKLPLITNFSIPIERKDTLITPLILKNNKTTSLNISEYNTLIDQVKNAIKNKNYSTAQSLFTTEGYQLYLKLIAYGNASVLPQSIPLIAYPFYKKVVVNSVPMLFSFAKSNRKFVEDVVFTFDSIKKISSVAFNISPKAIDDIMSKSDSFASFENKMQIIEFIQNYKTAYCLGRIDYLEHIFADDALIIVGNVLQSSSTNIDGIYNNLGKQKVEYLKISKKDYIEKLKTVFKSNEFVNIQFDENTVKKARPDMKVYGIQIAQNWYSSSYADKGYLFLMFDLTDSIHPQIYVRTWQPTKNADGSIYGISDFHF
jgi:hypothetical protein